MGLLYIIVVGIIAGWLAGVLIKGKGFGGLGNFVVGIIGAVMGKIVFGLLGIHTNTMIGEILFALAGAIIFLVILGIVRK